MYFQTIKSVQVLNKYCESIKMLREQGNSHGLFSETVPLSGLL